MLYYNKPDFLLAIIVTLLITACSSQKVPSKSVQACLDELPNSQLIKQQAVTTSCLVTAGLWKSIGQDNPASLICLAGGGAGFLLGKSIAERKCHYHIAEEQIKGEITHAQKVNLGFSFLFLQKSESLLKQKLVVSSLVAQHKERNINLVYLNSAKKEMAAVTRSERKLVNILLKEMAFKQNTLKISRRLNKKDQATALKKEIMLLNKNIKLFRKENLKLFRLENKLSGLS
jgi:hypothetical protein